MVSITLPLKDYINDLYALGKKFRKAGEILSLCPSALFCYNLKEG